jgi:hypothetical protein
MIYGYRGITDNCHSPVLDDQVSCECYLSEVKLEAYVNIEPEARN